MRLRRESSLAFRRPGCLQDDWSSLRTPRRQPKQLKPQADIPPAESRIGCATWPPPRPEDTPSPKEDYRAWRGVRQMYRGPGIPKAVLAEQPGPLPVPTRSGACYREGRSSRARGGGRERRVATILLPADLGMGGGAVADGFFGEEGLLAEAVGDFGEFAFVGTDDGQVVGLADQIERAQRFPDLLVARVDGGDLFASGHSCSRCSRERSDAPTDGGSHFCRPLTILQLGNQAALVDGRPNLIGVGHAAGTGSGNFRGL